ncbi:uncharacterized protein [Pseudorasbora parva]|uniref:uncharacterized protein n=1 Tax=Pseudorasbora parva TaxID=51549 RepID=UPI00351E924F
MACNEPSYWTLRRKAKKKVDQQLQTMQATTWGNELGCMHSDSSDTCQTQIDEDTFMDCVSHIDETEAINMASDLYDSESDTESGSETDQTSLEDDLATWATEHKITHVALNSLLNILRQHSLNLPKDSRTLLGTVRLNPEIQEKAGGQYYHFGVLNSITEVLHQNVNILTKIHTLELQVNIDGLPLFKSSATQFWPILGTLQNIRQEEPVTIGLFCGTCKPTSLSEYLEDFISEVNELEKGFEFEGVRLSLQLSSMVCDAPARAFLKKVKGHTGYHGCEKCTQDGVYLENRMTFPRNDMPLRNNESFRNKTDSDHHHGMSPLEETSLDMVSGFPLDYMHLVCLGIMRRLLHLWLKMGPLTCRLSGFQINTLTERLVNAQSNVPMEFARKPRALREIDRWKATEFRQFLLYTGPVMMKDLLSTEVYKNFLLLFVGISILSNNSLIEDYCDYANDILVLFVTHFGQLYGPQFLSYNAHSLIHLADDVKKHGILDNFSAFKYENHLNKLKRLLRKPTCPLSQIIKRFSEMQSCKKTRTKTRPHLLKKQHTTGPLPASFHEASQYKEIRTSLYTFKLDQANSHVVIGSKVAKLQNIISFRDEIYVAYSSFNQQESFFDYPLSSSTLGIHLVDDLSTSVKFCKLEEIENKIFLVPYRHHFVSIPLLHTD